MLAPLLLAATMAAAAPAKPPAFAPDAALRDVANADAALLQGIDRLLSTPFDAARIPQLRSAADDILTGSQAVVSACGALDSLMKPAALSAEAHASGSESAARRLDALYREQQRLRQRLAADRTAYNQACANPEPPRRSYCDKASDALRAADSAAADIDGPYKDADGARASVDETARRLREARAEYQSSRAALEQAQAPIPQAVVEFKSRADAIASAPEAENRTRAYRAQDDLLNPARQTHGLALPARDKAARFEDRYRSFARAAGQFTDAAAAASNKLDAFEAGLYSLENALR